MRHHARVSTKPMATAHRVGLTTGFASGVLFAAAAATAMQLLYAPPWFATTVGALAAGVAFGLPMGYVFAKRHRDLLDGFRGANATDVKKAQALLRHATRDADPSTRHLAAQLAQHQLTELERARPRFTLFFPAAAAAYSIAALLSSWWGWWIAAAFFAGFWLLTLQQKRSLRRRLQQLDDGSVEDGAQAGALH